MNHPFELKLSDLMILNLEVEETLTAEQAAEVGGGLLPEGYKPKPKPINWCGTPPPRPIPIEPPIVTTLALGEEGGYPPPICTKPLKEDGGALPW
ncbi:MAG: hypothetical protein C4288_20230 [Leptolyngbya sp. ERB_1_1]